jgi:hypothetical protein
MDDSRTTTPATFETASGWNAKFHLDVDLGVDPERTSLPLERPAIPRTYVIDPRTMNTARIDGGFDPTYAGLPGLEVLRDGHGAPDGG